MCRNVQKCLLQIWAFRRRPQVHSKPQVWHRSRHFYITSMVFGPTSNMRQPAGILSTSTIWVLASASNLSAMTASTGRINLSPDLPSMDLGGFNGCRFDEAILHVHPFAARKVFAIPPPMMSLSHFAASVSTTIILSLILAPPRMAIYGCSGLATALPRYSKFLFHQEAGNSGEEACNAFGGGMCTMGGTKRVIHIDVCQRRHLLCQL